MAHNPDMNGVDKLDIGIVPVKLSSKIGRTIAEVQEGRPMTNGNPKEDVCDLCIGIGRIIERT